MMHGQCANPFICQPPTTTPTSSTPPPTRRILTASPAVPSSIKLTTSNPKPSQDLWGIFLAHIVELLHSGVPQIRAAAIDALDRLLTGALGPAAAAAAAPAATAPATPPAARGPSGAQPAAGAAAAALTAGGIEHMLLVALESVYKEEREPDVRQGLLRVALHVLQRHGEHLSAGWVPLLRLLEAVPSWNDAATISTAFQSVESICRCGLGVHPCVRCSLSLSLCVCVCVCVLSLRPCLRRIGVIWGMPSILGGQAATVLHHAALACMLCQHQPLPGPFGCAPAPLSRLSLIETLLALPLPPSTPASC
jgi:hypothetical protein